MESKEEIRYVQIDGLVLLKIVTHSRDHENQQVTGQLLGLSLEGVLEITSAFPYPTKRSEGNDAYQVEMMKCLRTVNVDHNTVGWYLSTQLAGRAFINKQIVEEMYNYQKTIPNSVVIVYDPFHTKNGALSLKAYRLSDRFFDLYASGNFSLENLSKNKISPQDILQEIPVKVSNSSLARAYLYDLKENKHMTSEFERLDLSSHEYLEKNLDFLAQAIDDSAQEFQRFQYHQRQLVRQQQQQQHIIAQRKTENAARRAAGKPELSDDDLAKLPQFEEIPDVSHLDDFLISQQISQYSQIINTTTALGYNKLFVTDALAQNE